MGSTHSGTTFSLQALLFSSSLPQWQFGMPSVAIANALHTRERVIVEHAILPLHHLTLLVAFFCRVGHPYLNAHATPIPPGAAGSKVKDSTVLRGIIGKIIRGFQVTIAISVFFALQLVCMYTTTAPIQRWVNCKSEFLHWLRPWPNTTPMRGAAVELIISGKITAPETVNQVWESNWRLQCTTTDCGWTEKYACPSSPHPGSSGYYADFNMSADGFVCCCMPWQIDACATTPVLELSFAAILLVVELLLFAGVLFLLWRRKGDVFEVSDHDHLSTAMVIDVVKQTPMTSVVVPIENDKDAKHVGTVSGEKATELTTYRM